MAQSKDHYEVEQIVSAKITERGQKLYEVKWLGYPSNQNTFEPLRNLSKGARKLVQQFERSVTNYDNENYQSENQNESQYESESKQSRNKKTNKPQNRPRGRPRQYSPPEEIPQNIMILGLSKDQKYGLVFRIKVGMQAFWCTRQSLLPKHSRLLLEFYESCISWK